MIKVIVALIAFFAVVTISASSAEACISCDYVPSVAKSAPAKTYGAKRYNKRRGGYRSNTARRTRAVEKRTVRRKPTTKKRVVKKKGRSEKRIVERTAAPKKVETAKTAPIKSEAEQKNSTSSTATLENGYINCKALSVGCVVARSDPSKKTRNFGRLTVPIPSQVASGPRESKTLTRGVSKNDE